MSLFIMPERRTDLTTRAQIDQAIAEVNEVRIGIMFYHEVTKDQRAESLIARLDNEVTYYTQQDRRIMDQEGSRS